MLIGVHVEFEFYCNSSHRRRVAVVQLKVPTNVVTTFYLHISAQRKQNV